MIKDQVIKALAEASDTLGDKIQIEFPDNPSFGDYSSNIALGSKNPGKEAEEIVVRLNKKDNLKGVIERIEVAGPGFINFWLEKDVLLDNLIQIESKKEKYGSSNAGKGKTMVIDYSSPNIAKPFGIGHLRSTIVGQAIYNLYKFSGYVVIGDNHLGDWGTQFGKLLFKLQDIPLEKIKKLQIEDLEKLYVDFHKEAEDDPKMDEEARKWFKKLEDGDKKAKNLWQACKDISLKEFNRIYDLLGVKIDFSFGESYYESEMEQMVDDPKINKFLEKGENGALIIDLSKEGINTPLMFLKNDGASTYATRDLATIRFRVRKWNPDIIVYEVGAEQSLYFRQLFSAAKLTDLIKNSVSLIHTAHGLYLAPDGKKFSTRKGRTIKLDEVLSEAISRAEKLGNAKGEVAKQVGIGAIKYFDLMHSVQSDVVFDWDKIMNMEGNSGPYLQYTVARTNSLLAKSANKQIGKSIKEMENEEKLLLRSLYRFPGIISMSVKSYSPNILCNYLYDLAQKYNSFYNKYKIIGSENEYFRLLLTFGVGQVLKNGLKLLGIDTPDRM